MRVRRSGTLEEQRDTTVETRVFNFEATEEEMLGWYLRGVLQRTGGNQSEAQRVLAIHRATVRRRMAKLGLLR